MLKKNSFCDKVAVFMKTIKNRTNLLQKFLCLASFLIFLIFCFSAKQAFSLCGDVDGDGNIYSNDVLMVARASIRILTLDSEQLSRTDVYISGAPDGQILSNDLLIIARASLGMVVPKCAGSTCSLTCCSNSDCTGSTLYCLNENTTSSQCVQCTSTSQCQSGYTCENNVCKSPNTAPVITSTAIATATVGIAYTYDVNATDADGDTLSYLLTTNPTGMTINSTTGLISWTPTASGTYNVTVSVSDGKGGVVNQSLAITVIDSGSSSGMLTVTNIPTYSTTNTLTGAYAGQISLSGITIELTGTTYTTTTDSSGNFAFGNLPEGTYQIKIGNLYGPQFAIKSGVNTTIPTFNYCSNMSETTDSRSASQSLVLDATASLDFRYAAALGKIVPLYLINLHTYPNPYVSGTASQIAFSVDDVGGQGIVGITAKIYDIKGNSIVTVYGQLNKIGNDEYSDYIKDTNNGYRLAVWNVQNSVGSEIPPGVYLYLLSGEDMTNHSTVTRSSCIVKE